MKQELLQSSNELTAEDAAEHANRQEETWSSSDPSGAIECETAGRDNAVNMRVMLQVLSPCMQHTEQANIAPRCFGLRATSSSVAALA
jgi:hypothetical protein